ncbi:MAG: hypothetical protein KC933_11490, partial [Myxococcales bacterium]|nr:hypothetical protein [Myxococcales bacterium]
AGLPPAPDALLVFVASSLFSFDRSAGTLHEVGPTGYGALAILSPTYVPSTGALHVIVDFINAPTLATVDPCTGAVTRGPRITYNGTPVSAAEGLAIDASGTVFVSIKRTARSGPVTETIGTIDLGTGAVTALGTVTTLQNDVDQLAYGDGTLYALDVDTSVGQGGIYTIDPSTGAATLVVLVSDTLRRMIWDPVAHALIGATADTPDRQLVSIDLTTGALTPTHSLNAEAQLGGALVDALALLPGACPRELLTNFGYETPEPVCGFPTTAGDWAVDYSDLVASTSGVVPFTGGAMLRFVSPGFMGTGAGCGPQPGGASLDVAQLVDVSGCQAGTTLQLRAFFDAAAGASPGTGSCLVRAYSGALADFDTATPLSEQSGTVALDTNATTWQRCTTSLALPAGTTYVAAYLSATAATPTRFADDASLRAIVGGCP